VSNSIIEHIKGHRSVRSYLDKEVPEEILTEVLEAGLRASSSGNMQSMSIIVTREKAMKEKLFPLHFNQSMALEAPVLLTFCADFNRMKKWLTVSKAPQNFDNFMSFMIGSIDATLASQNCALAAESLGLGICYMGTTLASAHRIGEVLKLPKNVFPVVGFSLGYPSIKEEKKDRLSLAAIVHHEKYKDYSEEEISEIYKEREERGMKRYRSHPRLREVIDSSNAQNLAQVYTKVKYTRESHIEYSENILDYLDAQNFRNPS